MNRTFLAVVFATLALACEEGVDDTDTPIGTDVDTSSDTDTDAEQDTDDDSGPMVPCDNALVGGPLEGALADSDGNVVAVVRAIDRCGVVAYEVSYDFNGTIYPAFLLYSGEDKVAELWLEPRIYAEEDVEVSLNEDANGSPLWDGVVPLTVHLADAVFPEDVWASVVLRRTE